MGRTPIERARRAALFLTAAVVALMGAFGWLVTENADRQAENEANIESNTALLCDFGRVVSVAPVGRPSPMEGEAPREARHRIRVVTRLRQGLRDRDCKGLGITAAPNGGRKKIVPPAKKRRGVVPQSTPSASQQPAPAGGGGSAGGSPAGGSGGNPAGGGTGNPPRNPPSPPSPPPPAGPINDLLDDACTIVNPLLEGSPVCPSS